MLGILVHGDNHFIVEGPLPTHAAARRLVWQWEVPQLGAAPAASAGEWRLVTRAFREDLKWAVVLKSASAGPQLAVAQLLGELAGRGIEIHHGTGPWLARSASEWPGSAGAGANKR